MEHRTPRMRIGSAPTYSAPRPVNVMSPAVTTHIPQEYYDISGAPRSNADSEIQNNEPDLDATSKCQTCKERGKRCTLKYDQRGKCQECARLRLDCIQYRKWERMSAIERMAFTIKRKSATRSSRRTQNNPNLSTAPNSNSSRRLRDTASQLGEGSQSARRDLHASVGEMTITDGRAGGNLALMGSSNLHNGNMLTSFKRTTRIVDAAPPQTVVAPSSMPVRAYNQPQALETQNSMGPSDWVSTHVPGTVSNGAPSMPQEFVGYPIPAYEMMMMPQLDATDMETSFLPFPSNSIIHSAQRSPYSSCQPMPNHLLNPQVEAQPPQPALSPAPRRLHPPTSPSTSHLYDEIVRFQAYISALLPRASRIVIETEGTDGPEFIDLSALLSLANSPGPH